MKKIEGMRNHVVVCGYGKVGEKVCEVLDEYKREYVVVEDDPAIANLLRDMEVLVVEGDATHSRILRLAGVERAGALVATLKNDTSNVFIVLTARELNPNLIIATRAVSEEVVSKMHRAGAEIVVMPEVVGGLELGKEVIRKKLGIRHVEV